MSSPATLALFAGTAAVLLLVPGPAVFYIVTRSATQGTKAGLVSVLGVHSGTLVHLVTAVAGLSAVLAASATAFTTVKLAGACYLVYLGVRLLASARRGPSEPGAGAAPPGPHRSLRRVFADAVVVNVLNPKTAVFFLAFMPQFVRPEAGHPTFQLVVLGAVFIVLGLLSDGAYALLGGWTGRRLARASRTSRRMHVLAGGAYVGLGVATAASGGSTRPT